MNSNQNNIRDLIIFLYCLFVLMVMTIAGLFVWGLLWIMIVPPFVAADAIIYLIERRK